MPYHFDVQNNFPDSGRYGSISSELTNEEPDFRFSFDGHQLTVLGGFCFHFETIWRHLLNIENTQKKFSGHSSANQPLDDVIAPRNSAEQKVEFDNFSKVSRFGCGHDNTCPNNRSCP